MLAPIGFFIILGYILYRAIYMVYAVGWLICSIVEENRYEREYMKKLKALNKSN